VKIFRLIGKQIGSPSGFCVRLKRRANKAGIGKRVHLHGLRHMHVMEQMPTRTSENIPLNVL